MNEKITRRYECADCGEVLNPAVKCCPKCGSNRKNVKITAGETLTLQPRELRGKVKEKSGKVVSKFLKRLKRSKYGKEANEELHINIRENRKVHHVEEKDKDGSWKTVHHEDEPLKKKRIRS
jgi:predicted ATP-dependent serine protease